MRKYWTGVVFQGSNSCIRILDFHVIASIRSNDAADIICAENFARSAWIAYFLENLRMER